MLKRVKIFLRFHLEKFLGMPIANRIDAKTFTNPFLKKTYTDFGLDTRAAPVVGDAFDHQSLMGKFGVRENSYRERNKHSGTINIYYSSRMAPGKGFDMLISAFSKVQNKQNLRLICGESCRLFFPLGVLNFYVFQL